MKCHNYKDGFGKATNNLRLYDGQSSNLNELKILIPKSSEFLKKIKFS